MSKSAPQLLCDLGRVTYRPEPLGSLSQVCLCLRDPVSIENCHSSIPFIGIVISMCEHQHF